MTDTGQVKGAAPTVHTQNNERVIACALRLALCGCTQLHLLETNNFLSQAWIPLGRCLQMRTAEFGCAKEMRNLWSRSRATGNTSLGWELFMKTVSTVCLHAGWDRVQRYCGNVMVHAFTGAYVEVVVQLHLILTYAPKGGEWAAWRHGSVAPGAQSIGMGASWRAVCVMFRGYL
jgi:hypothetical protein